jgi:antirestriction protein ArdC
MNIYQTVTDRILRQLESGVVPWRKNWTTGLPKSLSTGREYRGINVVILGTAEYTSRYWVTYRQALQLGGHVRKGERATPVIYWKWRTPEEMEKRRRASGKDSVAPCVPFVSAVFNLDQVDGIEGPEDDVPNRQTQPLQVAADMFDVMPDKPEIVHGAGRNPAYCPTLDRILLPHLSQFDDAHAYYQALFHEAVHSTGHPRRLNRFEATGTGGFAAYSFEELVAEFGAAFLTAFAGIRTSDTEAQNASYIAGWAEAIRNDNRLILLAASAAQRAADYIRGKPIAEPNPVESDPAAEPARPTLAIAS